MAPTTATTATTLSASFFITGVTLAPPVPPATARRRKERPDTPTGPSSPVAVGELGPGIRASPSVLGLACGQSGGDQPHHRGVLQGGHVAQLALFRDVPQQPAHDLAGPRL